MRLRNKTERVCLYLPVPKFSAGAQRTKAASGRASSTKLKTPFYAKVQLWGVEHPNKGTGLGDPSLGVWDASSYGEKSTSLN